MLAILSAIARDRFSWFFLVVLCGVFAWDHHGRMGWIGRFIPGWQGIGNAHDGGSGPGIFGLAWDQELIGFVSGFFLVVALPACLVKWLLRARLSDFGFGWPAAGGRKKTYMQVTAIAALSFPGFYLAAYFPTVRDYYPYYRGDPLTLDFVAYELAASLFYISIEGLFRGFILFGIIRWLSELTGDRSRAGDLRIAAVAIVLSILPYAIWHLDKAPAELWGTLFWGVVAGASAVSTRTIWHLVCLHWLLNVFMDYLILLDR
jgi:Type II CAAX prenyl endopeptidase Rce1-like